MEERIPNEKELRGIQNDIEAYGDIICYGFMLSDILKVIKKYGEKSDEKEEI